MAHLINHMRSVVGQPPDIEVPVWRYTDLAGFVALLASRSLSFCRSDQFQDPFEGTIPTVQFDRFRDAGNIKYLQRIEQIRRLTFINCWHMNPGESDAMWRLYAPDGKGVVVRSTYQSLESEIPTEIGNDKIHLGTVIYRDYDDFDMEEGNFHKYFFSKRSAFAHEQEVRLYLPPSNVNPNVPDGPLRRPVPVNVNGLIHEVRVSPTSGEWFRRLVVDIMQKYGIEKPVKLSRLCHLPNLLDDHG